MVSYYKPKTRSLQVPIPVDALVIMRQRADRLGLPFEKYLQAIFSGGGWDIINKLVSQKSPIDWDLIYLKFSGIHNVNADYLRRFTNAAQALGIPRWELVWLLSQTFRFDPDILDRDRRRYLKQKRRQLVRYKKLDDMLKDLNSPDNPYQIYY